MRAAGSVLRADGSLKCKFWKTCTIVQNIENPMSPKQNSAQPCRHAFSIFGDLSHIRRCSQPVSTPCTSFVGKLSCSRSDSRLYLSGRLIQEGRGCVPVMSLHCSCAPHHVCRVPNASVSLSINPSHTPKLPNHLILVFVPVHIPSVGCNEGSAAASAAATLSGEDQARIWA